MRRHEWVKFLASLNSAVNVLVDDLLRMVVDYLPHVHTHVFDRDACDPGVTISADGLTATGMGRARSKYSLAQGELVFSVKSNTVFSRHAKVHANDDVYSIVTLSSADLHTARVERYIGHDALWQVVVHLEPYSIYGTPNEFHYGTTEIESHSLYPCVRCTPAMSFTVV